MKNKKKENKNMKNKFKELKEKFIVFNNTTYGMLIVVSWVVLLICLIIKLFGGNWFELWWDNEKFISFCNYVENTMWLKMSIACVIFCASGYISLCVILNEKLLSKKHLLLFLPLMIIKSILNWYLTIIPFILDIFILLGLTTIINKNFKRNIICFLLITSFQILSIIFRNVSFDFNIGNTLIENYLIQIDYYLMLILFYLYNFKRKEIKE